MLPEPNREMLTHLVQVRIHPHLDYLNPSFGRPSSTCFPSHLPSQLYHEGQISSHPPVCSNTHTLLHLDVHGLEISIRAAWLAFADNVVFADTGSFGIHPLGRGPLTVGARGLLVTRRDQVVARASSSAPAWLRPRGL